MKPRSNHRAGLMAEQLALLWLMLKGYWLIARRYKTPHGEIDLILRRRKTLIFVEVKARPRLEDAAFAIHPKNQSRVLAAAQQFLRNHPAYGDFQVRFDAVLIAWYKRPHHLVDAFQAT